LQRIPGNNVLLVEDDPSHVDLITRAFQRGKISNPLVVARDGAEALDILFPGGGRAARTLPCLVLLDLRMPRVGGLEVLRRIRRDRDTHRIPVVIVTSSSADPDLENALSSGANSYIQKPGDAATFERVIAEVQRYWLGLNEPPC
jgi:two-component system response regulator